MNQTGRLIGSSAFIALGIIFPMVFHSFGASGSIFLPMHFPVLIAGLFLGPYSGFMVGVFAPILSSFLTGMPPVMPVLPVMIVELSIYGVVSGYVYRSKSCNLLVALLCSMLAGRLAAIIIVYTMATMLHINLNPIAYVTTGVVTGLPGIIIQFITVPLLVKRLQSAFTKYY